MRPDCPKHNDRREHTGSHSRGHATRHGDVGACVVVRPDALAFYGKNDCWDIRVSETSQNHVLPFKEYFNYGHAPAKKPNGWKAYMLLWRLGWIFPRVFPKGW